MAPRKEKTEKASADKAPDMILEYLQEEAEVSEARRLHEITLRQACIVYSRPYSATDVSNNLHNKVTKTAAAKHLKEMHERKEIEGRASGKQLVYHAIQTIPDEADSTPITSIMSDTATLREETTALQAEAKALRTRLAALAACPSTSDLQTRIAELEAEKAKMLARLQPLRKGNVKKVSNEEKDELEKEGRKWTGIEQRRKRIARDMWDFVRDSIAEGTDVGEVWVWQVPFLVGDPVLTLMPGELGTGRLILEA